MQGVAPRHHPIPAYALVGGGYGMPPQTSGLLGKLDTDHEAPVEYLHVNKFRTAPWDLKAN